MNDEAAKAEPEKMPLTSMDVAQEKREQFKRCLAAAFPEIMAEDKIDFDQLKRVLGEWVEPDRERFGLNWPGKAACMKVIQAPSVGTLKPCREESVDWDTTQNVFIEGDNLEVLKLLQKAYFGKIKMIYIDPPYNTGAEFIYPDKYSETLDTYLEYTGQKDIDGRKFSTNTEASGRYHSRWLNMMYSRLYLAKNLLAQDGVVFISIGQDEISNLLQICLQLFGEENFLTVCSRVMKTGGQKGVHFSPCIDYVLVFAKNVNELKPFRAAIGQKVIDTVYTKTEIDGPRAGEKYRSMGLYQAMLDKRANQRYYIECPDGTLAIPPGNSFPTKLHEGSQIAPADGDGVWRWTYSRFSKEKQDNNIEFVKSERTSLVNQEGKSAGWNIYYKIWLNDRLEDGQLPGNILEKFESRHSSAELKILGIPFDFAKPSSLVKYLMSLSGVNDGDIVLDFFAGSASTAHAVMDFTSETSRKVRYICVQLPERTADNSEEARAGFRTISQIGRERIRRVAENFKVDLSTKHLGSGFRAFSLDRSCFQLWDGDAQDLDEKTLLSRIENHVEHIDPRASAEELLFELLLKDGFPLTVPMQRLEVAGKEVFSVAEGALLICLERELTQELMDALAEMEPARVICLDAGFKGNDQLKANAVQTFKIRARNKETAIEFRTV